MPLSTPIDVNPDTSLGLENQQGLGYTSGGGMTAVGWVDPLCGDPMFGEFSYYPAYVDPADDEIREVGTGSTPNAPAMGLAMARPPSIGPIYSINETMPFLAEMDADRPVDGARLVGHVVQGSVHQPDRRLDAVPGWGSKQYRRQQREIRRDGHDVFRIRDPGESRPETADFGEYLGWRRPRCSCTRKASGCSIFRGTCRSMLPPMSDSPRETCLRPNRRPSPQHASTGA